MDLQSLTSICVTIFACTGFWQFLGEWIKSKSTKKSVTDKLLLGLAHDRIHYLCNKYKKKGYIDEDEYDTLKSIAEPYLEMGGNGSGRKLYEECLKLPLKSTAKIIVKE